MALEIDIQYILAKRKALKSARTVQDTMESIEAARSGKRRPPRPPSEMDIVWDFLETCYKKYSNPLQPDWLRNVYVAGKQLESLIKRGVTTVGFSPDDSDLTVFTKIALADGSLPRVMPLPPPRSYPHP